MNKKNLLLGAHVSTTGGFDKSIDRAEEIEANCIQIFTKSNRQWRAKTITKEDATRFIMRKKASNVQVVVAHAAYLINLGSKNNETVDKSIHSLAEELSRCELLNIPYLILHPGTSRFESEEASLKFVAEQLDKAFEQSKTKNVMLLIETMAGQGSMLGRTFEQLAAILQHCKHKKRLGVCFDTCHAFAAGYEFDTPELYEKMWKHFDQTVGINQVKVFHVNDSKREQGSCVDRHEHIGQGKISKKSFELLMQDKNFTDVPKILETPKGDDEVASDTKNLSVLRKLAKNF